MRTSFRLVTMFTAVLLVAGGCGGGGSFDTAADVAGDEGQVGDDLVADLAGDDLVGHDSVGDTGGDGDCVPTLEFVGEPESVEFGADIVMSRNASRTISLQYGGCDGMEGVAIDLELLDGEPFCQIDVQTVLTDSEGEVAFTVTSESSQGVCHIQACVSGRDDVCVTVTVMVPDGHMSPLIVMFDPYQGAWTDKVNAVKVRLIKQTDGTNIKCADLDPRNLPGGDIDSNWVELRDVIQFTMLPNLKTELEQDYTIIAMAYEYDTDETAANPLRAWACNDTDGHVEWGDFTQVTLSLVDLAPSIAGTWEIDSTFELLDAMPPTIEKILDIQFGIMTDPVGYNLLLMCDESILGMEPGDDFCSLIFLDPQAPALDGLTDFGVFVAAMMDANLDQMLVAACPYTDSPELCANVYYTAQDVGTPLNKIGVKSTMTCTVDPEPGAEGGAAVIAAGDCSEVWHSLKLRWTLGLDCEPTDLDCGVQFFSLAAIPGIGQVIHADIGGALLDGRDLRIDRHPVGLKVGAIIDFAVQNVMLPRLFGDGTDGLPAVMSFEDLAGALMGGRDCLTADSCCADFETALTVQYPEIQAGIAQDACQALLDDAFGFMRDQVALMDAGSSFLTGTPDDAPAPMFDNNDDMVFDAIGTETETCAWDAILRVNTFDYQIDSTFHGVRD